MLKTSRSDVLSPARVQEAETVGWVYRSTVHAMQQNPVQETARATQARRSAGVPRARHTSLVRDERVEKALHFLAETDQPSAELKAQIARCEYACKLARARMFLLSDRQGVEARKAEAESSHDVQQAEARLADTIVEAETLAAKRKTNALIVDVWRTCEASRRIGNL